MGSVLECHATEEREGSTGQMARGSQVHLFRTHVCIYEPGCFYGLCARRRALPLQELLGVSTENSDDDGLLDSSREWHAVVLQMRGAPFSACRCYTPSQISPASLPPSPPASLPLHPPPHPPTGTSISLNMEKRVAGRFARAAERYRLRATGSHQSQSSHSDECNHARARTLRPAGCAWPACSDAHTSSVRAFAWTANAVGGGTEVPLSSMKGALDPTTSKQMRQVGIPTHPPAFEGPRP